MKITDNLSIKESEIDLQAVRASGPGGQKVNKTASAVQLFFDVNISSFFLKITLQKSVDGLDLISGGFLHSLGIHSGRCGQEDFCFEPGDDFQDGV